MLAELLTLLAVDVTADEVAELLVLLLVDVTVEELVVELKTTVVEVAVDVLTLMELKVRLTADVELLDADDSDEGWGTETRGVRTKKERIIAAATAADASSDRLLGPASLVGIHQTALG